MVNKKVMQSFNLLVGAENSQEALFNKDKGEGTSKEKMGEIGDHPWLRSIDRAQFPDIKDLMTRIFIALGNRALNTSSDKRSGEDKEAQDEQAIGKQIFNSVPPQI